MSTAILTAVTFLVEEAFKLVPGFIADLLAIFGKSTPPTSDDFAALRAKVASESYAQFVPGSALPPETAASAPPLSTKALVTPQPLAAKAGSTCPTCGTVNVPNDPGNCNCVNS